MSTLRPCSAAATAGSTQPQRASPRADDPAARQGADAFARALRDKAAARDGQADPDGKSAEPVTPTPSVPAALPPMPPLAPAPVAQRAAVQAPEPNLSATHAALEAALDAGPSLPLMGGTGNGAAATWEVSVREPLGVALEMRATRAAGASGAEAHAPWTLTIASPTLGAAALAQHAPRLNERLRARALKHTHVRIERDDPEP